MFRRIIQENSLDQFNPSIQCQGFIQNMILQKLRNASLKTKQQNCSDVTMIRKGNVSKIQISEKLIQEILKTINTSKGKISYLQISKYVKLYVKYTLSQNKDQVLGGGGCCSKSEIHESNLNAVKIIDETFNNNNKNNEFVNEYIKLTDQELIRTNIQKDNQLEIQKKLLKLCTLDKIIQSNDQINTHCCEIQEIFETFLMLEVTRVSNKSEVNQLEIQKILQELKAIDQYKQDFPIMELMFYIDVLIDLNKLNYKFDEREQKLIMQIKGFVDNVLKFNKNESFSAVNSRAKEVKQNIDILFKKKELFALKYQVEILLRKIEQFKDKFYIITQEEEILFYVKIFLEMKNKQDLQDYNYTILTLIRINFILEKFQREKCQSSNKAQICQQFRNVLIKANIDQFLNELMQKQDNFINKSFLVFSVENYIYRYISLNILLSIYSISTMTLQNIHNQEYMLEFLFNKYLAEKELAIRVIFEKSPSFIEYFNQNIKLENFKKRIVEFDQQRKKNLQPHIKSLKNHERSINSFDDIIKLIAYNAIQKWERDIKKRQKSNISQKDDVLLEVRDLYISQMITHLNGNPIFQKTKEHSLNQQNCIQDIFKLFLNDAKVENQIKNQNNQCQILGILAEGGTGKSMLMKKIETLLIEKLSNLNTETETGNYLPILVKCNSLDPKNPSLEEYLKQQDINEDMIKSLKQNERNKLILLDGYDEYTGDYFKIYSTLRIAEWKNTKIIVATRKEKHSKKDACFFFSKKNEKEQIDEMSYTLVRLEEFTSKDIDEYAGRYFKQERADKMDLLEQDLKNLRSCLANKHLEKLLQLPINLYLFTRMLINLDNQEIQNLKIEISDQIGIQEIFFSDQFEREAQSFIDAYVNSIDLKSDKKFRAQIKNCYFEYFQTIGMVMFQNRGVIQGNYLQVERQNINFNISQSVEQILEESQVNSLLNKIENYINSKIITRVKTEQQQNINQAEHQQQFIEFKHKSLYEYFVVRAMKNDFDTHGENIHTLKIEELQQFKINQKCIMNIGQNQSEQQILVKLYKLIKNQIESDDFCSNYHEDLIEKNNRYIQYLKRSQIQTNTETSKIDIGASNLISVLFLSKLSFPKLNLTLCSFSKAYISTSKSIEINLDRCNLKYAFLQNSKINFDSCHTHAANFDAFSKVFDTSDIYSFNKVLWGNNVLYTISKSGFINSFKMNKFGFQLFNSKQLSQLSLSDIQFADQDHFLVSSKYTLFLIKLDNFEICETHKFNNAIKKITQIEESILILLENKSILKGTFKDGFQQLNHIGIVSGSAFNNKSQILATYYNQSFSLWDRNKNFELINTFQGHTGEIYSVAFSSDGKYLATGSEDKTCKIWNVEKGFELINTIEDHIDYIYSVAFSADGKYLATGSDCEDQTCKIWNVEKGFELINTIKGHYSRINFVAFSEDGKYLATGSGDHTCKIWNVEKGFELINSIEGHTSRILSVAFSTNGKYLATGSGDHTCKIWNVEKSFELINSIEGHTSYISSVAFSEDGKYLATGSWDETCKIWNVEKGFELINTIQGHTKIITTVAFSADGKYLATGSEDKTCKIWNVEKGFELINTIQGNSGFLTCVAFSVDGKYLATCCNIYKICKIWNVKKGFELINTIYGHTDIIIFVAFSADGKYLATGSRDETCKIWNVEKGFELINTIQGHNSYISSVAFSADGKYLATGTGDQVCKIWNVEKGFKIINTIQGHSDKISSVAFSADGKYLATGSEDQTCKIWNVEKSFELINKTQGHTREIYSVAFSVDGKYLATGSGDQTCKIWNLENGFELINTIQGHNDNISSVAFSADGKYLATGTENQTYKIWNVEKGFELINTIKGHAREIYSVAFSADRKYLATGSGDKSCKIWNVEKDFELIKKISGHTGEIYSVAFSADGKYLATGSEDKTCKIWNVEQGFELINTIEDHIDYIYSVAFSVDGKYLATGSEDKTCKIWNVEKGFELISTIQGHTSDISSVAFSADGKYLVTGSWDETCKIWNVEQGFELINTIQGHTQKISSVAFSEDGKYLATGSEDQTCKIWYAEKGFELVNTIQDHTREVSSVAYSADGKYLATGSGNQTCKIWQISNLKKPNLIKTLESVDHVQFSIDSKFLSVVQINQNQNIYDITNFKQVNKSNQENFEKIKNSFQNNQNEAYQINRLKLFYNIYCF